jgi:hypothetical protein
VPDDGEDHREDDGLTTRLGLCAAFAMNAMLNSVPAYLGMKQDEQFAELFRLLAAFFATLAMLVGGSYFATRPGPRSGAASCTWICRSPWASSAPTSPRSSAGR